MFLCPLLLPPRGMMLSGPGLRARSDPLSPHRDKYGAFIFHARGNAEILEREGESRPDNVHCFRIWLLVIY